MQNENFSEAISLYHQAGNEASMSGSKTSASVMFNLSLAHLRSSQLTQAITGFKDVWHLSLFFSYHFWLYCIWCCKVIEADSQHFQAHTALGVVLLQVLDQSPDRVDLVESAIRAFSAANQLQPTNEDWLLCTYALHVPSLAVGRVLLLF